MLMYVYGLRQWVRARPNKSECTRQRAIQVAIRKLESYQWIWSRRPHNIRVKRPRITLVHVPPIEPCKFEFEVKGEVGKWEVTSKLVYLEEERGKSICSWRDKRSDHLIYLACCERAECTSSNWGTRSWVRLIKVGEVKRKGKGKRKRGKKVGECCLFLYVTSSPLLLLYLYSFLFKTNKAIFTHCVCEGKQKAGIHETSIRIT